jgi:hypothetical protein
MGSAHPPLDPAKGSPATSASATTDPSDLEVSLEQDHSLPRPVSQQELNSWRRGFTPQAEIWNGRLAMVGLSVGLTVLIVARLTHHG